MDDLPFHGSPRPAFTPQALETVDVGELSFFARDIEALVMQACRARGLGFDLFATRFNVPRETLLEILRGSQPVTTYTRRILEDFVLRALGQGGTVARTAAAPSPATQSPPTQSSVATRGERL